MTDRELLELAAKAAGYSVRCIGDGCRGGDVFFYMEPDSLYWNPLADDGDALRLAVKLPMIIHLDGLNESVVRVDYNPPCGFAVPLYERTRNYDGDKAAATRRAIVRAAAAIGKAMP